MVMDFLVVVGLVGIVLLLLIVVSGWVLEDEFLSSYECGFDMFMGARFDFSFRFFVLAMLFIVFDVEISLLLSVPYLNVGVMFVALLLSFMWILLLGTIYEVMLGSMEWV